MAGRAWSSLLLACALVGACGRSNTVSEGDQRAALDAALERVRSTVARGTGFDYASLRLELLKDARLQLAGTSPDGELWVMAGEDGPLLVVSIDPTPIASFARRQALKSERPGVRAEATQLPKVTRYRLYSGLGSAFTDPTQDLADLLDQRGYSSAGTRSPTVQELRGVKLTGVLFFKTHSTIRRVTDPFTGKEQSYFSLYTSTPYPMQETAQDREDLLKRRLIVFAAVNSLAFEPDEMVETHYAITADFVRTYMAFPDNSFAMVNACNTATADAGDMQQAFFDAGLSVFAGWDKQLKADSSDDTARYLFDRLLGTNAFRAEEPPQRPFDYQALQADLARKGLDRFPSPKHGGEAHLLFIPNPANPEAFGLLAPSIERMKVNEREETLEILGLFGLDYGAARREVTINGAKVDVKSWEKDKIVCELLPGLAGDVIVSVDGRKSNTVQLTEWVVPLTFTDKTDMFGTYEAKVDATCRFRADVHDRRTAPGEAPVRPEAVEVLAEASSSAKYSLTYDWKISDQLFGRTSGSGEITTVAQVGPTGSEPAGPSYLMCEGTIDVAAHKISVSLRVFQKDGVLTTSSIGSSTSDFTEMMTAIGGLQQTPDNSLVRGSVAELALDGYNLPAQKLSGQGEWAASGPDGAPLSGTIDQTLECPEVQAWTPPAEDAAR